MEQNQWFRLLEQQRVLAVIRAPSLKMGIQMGLAARGGGLRLIEVTWNSHRPAELVAQLRQQIPDGWIGAGTLLTPAALKDAIAAGAQFGFSPHTDVELIQLARRCGCPFVPGALTPSEIVMAWQSGASGVKVFPISAVGGASYIRSLQGPLGQIPLIPTGGVTSANAAELIQAGAMAIGLSSSLFPMQVLSQQDWSWVAAQAEQILRQLQAHLH